MYTPAKQNKLQNINPHVNTTFEDLLKIIQSETQTEKVAKRSTVRNLTKNWFTEEPKDLINKYYRQIKVHTNTEYIKNQKETKMLRF